jgi:hypothetical protein
VANAKNLAIGDPIVGIRSDIEFVPKTIRIQTIYVKFARYPIKNVLIPWLSMLIVVKIIRLIIKNVKNGRKSNLDLLGLEIGL